MTLPANLNYHHLRYFWVIANEGGLTKAAVRLNVAQSALSVQLRQLEESLGHALFERRNRRLILTEAGKVALHYAGTIFRGGDELVDTLRHRSPRTAQVLRVGAVATLSRNFQWEFLKPLRKRSGVRMVLRSGSLRDLAAQLRNLEVDVVLSNQALRRDAESWHHSHLLAEQEVSLVSRPEVWKGPFRFPEDFSKIPALLPSMANDVRSSFDLLLDRAGIRPVIAAEVDDMAMLRVLAMRFKAIALVPRVVVQDELRSGVLSERCRLPEITERYYAITPNRSFPNALVKELITEAAKPASRGR